MQFDIVEFDQLHRPSVYIYIKRIDTPDETFAKLPLHVQLNIWFNHCINIRVRSAEFIASIHRYGYEGSIFGVTSMRVSITDTAIRNTKKKDENKLNL